MIIPSNHSAHLSQLIQLSLQEDIGTGDLTSLNFIDRDDSCHARIIAKQAGCFSGSALIQPLIETFIEFNQLTSDSINYHVEIAEGQAFANRDILLTLKGNTQAILGLERTLLNFLQRLCGVASLTAQYKESLQGLPTQLLDTRKTTPGWRILEKQAVLAGGGNNHRMGLYDAVMLKDNHFCSLADLQAKLCEFYSEHPTTPIILEADTLGQVRSFLELIAKQYIPRLDVILLDNMPPATIKDALRLRGELGLDSKILYEASGGININNIYAYAKTGVERISIGALTHSATNLDLSLEII